MVEDGIPAAATLAEVLCEVAQSFAGVEVAALAMFVVFFVC